MTHRSRPGRAVQVGALARVEGEGGLSISVEGDRVTDVRLRIYEPPRFFEAFLRGRAYTEPPDITARICGICPVAYQMSACLAIEDACGVSVGGQLAELRRLLYFGEWIESHGLHIYLLHAPDFLGYPGAVEMARDHRDLVNRGLQMKKVGNDLVSLVGGRAIHPVNIRVGGFYRVPVASELRTIRDRLARGFDQAVDTVRWVGGFDFPDNSNGFPYVALTQPGGYAVMGGRIASTSGLGIDISSFGDTFEEHQVEHSTALHAQMRDGGHYLVGPLARYALNREMLLPAARQVAAEAGLGDTCRNPSQSIVVRAVEIVHAFEGALAIVDSYERPDSPSLPVEPRAGTGHGATEAPRGLLYHRYEIDSSGRITDARIVPPTSQNQAAIEHDLAEVVQDSLHLDDAALTRRCEEVVRSYDPCISCAAHFLDVTIDRSPG